MNKLRVGLRNRRGDGIIVEGVPSSFNGNEIGITMVLCIIGQFKYLHFGIRRDGLFKHNLHDLSLYILLDLGYGIAARAQAIEQGVGADAQHNDQMDPSFRVPVA